MLGQSPCRFIKLPIQFENIMDNREFVGVVGGDLGHSLFDEIISTKNLFAAWREFRLGKKNKKDVKAFAFNLEENLVNLHRQLADDAYVHGLYQSFFVSDPKRRHIHKARVRDRILHHAIHRVLYPIFDNSFIFDSYSSRIGKGTHAAVDRFEELAWRQSANDTKTVWVLQCDIRKFFDSVDHGILLETLAHKFGDKKLIHLLAIVILSFHKFPDKGLPLGNLTSQLFSNVYLDSMDHFIKRSLGIKGYVRYADDFLLISQSRYELEVARDKIASFLKTNKSIDLHPSKTIIAKWHSGIDILGYKSFPHYRILRNRTKRRAIANINPVNRSSYLSLLNHCRGHGLYKLLA